MILSNRIGGGSRAVLLACAGALLCLGALAAPEEKAVTVAPDLMLYGQGENVDTMGIWEAPDPADTRLYVSAKDNQLVEVWKYPFANAEQAPLRHPGFAHGSVNGVAVDQEEDLLYIIVGDAPASGFVFDLPSLDFRSRFINGSRDLFGEPNCALLKTPGQPDRIYVSSDNAISIHNAASGEELALLPQPTDVETVFADDYYQCIYVPDENDRSGVNVYTPEGEPFLKEGTNHFGTGVFQDDAEGIWVYKLAGHGAPDDGRGYIIVSDQRSPLTDYEFFDRCTWQHLGTLNLEGVANTDGIASTQRPLPGYPLGFFAAIHDDQAVAIAGWDKVLTAMGLPATSEPKPMPAPEVSMTKPQRVVLSLAGDPTTSAAVTWRTPGPASETVLQLAPAVPDVNTEPIPEGGSKTRYVNHADYATTLAPTESEALQLEGKSYYYHSAEMTGLSPDTAYAYRVGSGDDWTEWNVFRTAPADPKTWRFLYFGDAQNDIFSQWSHLVRASVLAAPDAAFLLCGGDLVGDGEMDTDWEEWFAAPDWVLRSVPLLATPGNHEYWEPVEDQTKELAPFWQAQFAFPKDGPAGLDEEAWSLRVGEVLLVSLNSMEDLEVQSAWLREALARNAGATWTIVTHHHPVYSSGRGRDNPELRAAWRPIYEEMGVDLVLCGHDHTFARTPRLLDGQLAPDGGPGVVYLNSVSGPKQYAFGPLHEKLFSRTAEGTQLFQVVTFGERSLKAETFMANGVLYDSFTLWQDAEGGVSYIDQAPRTPERRRPSAN